MCGACFNSCSSIRAARVRDALIDALFPALDPGAGANALAKAISRARAAVGRDLVESTRSYVRLARPVWTDLGSAVASLEDALATNGASLHQSQGDSAIPNLDCPRESAGVGSYSNSTSPLSYWSARVHRDLPNRVSE